MIIFIFFIYLCHYVFNQPLYISNQLSKIYKFISILFIPNKMNRQIRKKAFKQREKYGEFLRKLYQILDDVDQDYGIRWRVDGHGVTISNTGILVEDTLPQIFGHRDLKQFERQLKEYWFEEKYDQLPRRSFAAGHCDKDVKNTKINTRTKVLGLRTSRNKLVQMYDIKKQESVSHQNQSVSQKHPKIQNQDSNSKNNFGQITNNLNDQRLEKSNNYQQDEYGIQDQQLFDEKTQRQLVQIGNNQIDIRFGPLDQFVDKSIYTYVDQISTAAQERQMYRAELQYLRDDIQNKRVTHQDIFNSQQTISFKYFYIYYMQFYETKKLTNQLNFISSYQTKKLPYIDYINDYRILNPFCSIGQRKIPFSQNNGRFSQNSRELQHNGTRVDFDQFIKYDWTQFQILRFQGCQLRNVDWTKLCNYVKENIPRLKELYLNDNKITIIKKGDFEQFLQLRKIELKGNNISPLCEQIFDDFSNKNPQISIKRY